MLYFSLFATVMIWIADDSNGFAGKMQPIMVLAFMFNMLPQWQQAVSITLRSCQDLLEVMMIVMIGNSGNDGNDDCDDCRSGNKWSA